MISLVKEINTACYNVSFQSSNNRFYHIGGDVAGAFKGPGLRRQLQENHLGTLDCLQSQKELFAAINLPS